MMGAGGYRNGQGARRRGPRVEHDRRDLPLVDCTSRIDHALWSPTASTLQDPGEDRRRYRVAPVDTRVRSSVARDRTGSVSR